MEDIQPEKQYSNKERIKFVVGHTWKFMVTILAPLVFLPIFLWHPGEGREKAPYGLYLICLMCTYWISECIPLPITSLMPVIFVPLFGIADSDSICSGYFNQTIMFLYGGCVVALAFEYSNLHARIAFAVMKSMGAQPSVLLFGMMFTSMLLSCWMNNTSTTAMMVPVIFSIMKQYESKLIPEETPEELAEKYGDQSISPGAPSKAPEPENLDKESGVEENTSPDSPEPASSPGVEDEKGKGDVKATASDSGTLGKQIASEDTSTLRVVFSATTENTTNTKRQDEAIAYWTDIINGRRKYVRNLEIMFLNGVAAASNIGGTGIITGTGTNLIAAAQLRTARMNVESGNMTVKNLDACLDSENQNWELDFMRWAILCVPCMLVNTLVAWAFLAIFFQGPPRKLRIWFKTNVLKKKLSPLEEKQGAQIKEVEKGIRGAIRKKYEDLGSTSLHQWLVLILFLLLVGFWIFRNPLFARGKSVNYHRSADPTDYKTNKSLSILHPVCLKGKSKLKYKSSWGWARFFGDKCDEEYIHDYVPTLFICVLLFIIPKEAVYYKTIFKGGLGRGFDDPLMPFEYVAENIPWGPLFMLGGGFGISKIMAEANLSAVLREILANSKVLQEMNEMTLMITIIVVVAFVTALASNTATAVIVSPVVILLGQSKGFPPLYLLLPPIVAASYAFALPISTPPNAIVYDKANMKQLDMLVPGVFLTIITNIVLVFFAVTYVAAVLKVSSYNGACDPLNNETSGRSGNNLVHPRMIHMLYEHHHDSDY